MFAPKQKKSDMPQVEAPMMMPTPTAPAPRMEPEPTPVCPRTDSANIIGKGTVINGNIQAEGDLIIEGTVRGDVATKTTLIVGRNCVIEGNILAEHAEVAGQVKGTVQALGLLVIKSSSMIDGDVLTKNLNVESGSTFNGRFTVGSVTTAAPKKQEAPNAPRPDVNVLGSDPTRRPIPVPAAPPVKV